jgi:hypothetical protein
MSEEQDAEIARLKAEITRLRDKLERSTSTCFKPGDELVWFDVGEVSTMGAHTHISGSRNYVIHQADGYGSDQLFTVKRYDEETSTATIIGRDLPDWKAAKAVAQADFDRGRWFYFHCERCGRNSDTDGFLLDGDYNDCYPCQDCQPDRDVEMPMTFRPATKEEEWRLEKRKYDPSVARK